MSFLTRLLLLTLLVGSCVPQNVEDFILLTLESIAARQERLLQKFDEQETKIDSQQTMMKEQETKMETLQTMLQERDSKIESKIEELTRRLTGVETSLNSTQEEQVSKFSREEQYYLTMTEHFNELSNLKRSTDKCLTTDNINTFQSILAKDECLEGRASCSASATCKDGIGHYKCVCMSGYSGDGLNCEDINECAEITNICGEGGFCINQPGTYGCLCQIGFKEINNFCTEIKNSNCKELLDSGVIRSGVYTINPEGFPDGVKVYCDQETDGGGWNVILRRQKQTRQVNFKKNFEEYAAGFGDPNGELWIGNRVLHSMTGEEPFTLRVDAKNLEGESRTGIWQTFSVGSEDTEFTLSVANYSSSSTLGDGLWKPSASLDSANNMKFSTIDRDNDRSSGRCSATYGHGGWWYNHCYGANPTVPFGDTNGDNTIANWQYWESSSSESSTAISEIQFLIRP